jgi:hypothetical protein
LPKHVGAIVKSKETYNLVHLLVCLYIVLGLLRIQNTPQTPPP